MRKCVQLKKKTAKSSKQSVVSPIAQTMNSKVMLLSESPRSQIITSKIGRIFALDCQPFSVVQDCGFRELRETLEPCCQIPSRKHFTRSVVPKLYSSLPLTQIPIYAVSDNAKNMSSALTGKPVEHLSCAAHNLQLAVSDAFAEVGLDSLLKTCRSIVGHYKHTTKSRERLQSLQKNRVYQNIL
ncbi:hypothetical protein PR048_023132 [Dryococelus australis]|uniref:Uncharacterized protein n=1 Tax=Dryococelus australis TaxID=614101 RepID=A0ABQ9GT73_9NEOP|nr:hypothetical protein PR048_023132 [Dryococelus australis]